MLAYSSVLMVLSTSYALEIKSVTFDSPGPTITGADFETTDGDDFNVNTGASSPLSLSSLVAGNTPGQNLTFNILDLPFDIALQRSDTSDTTSNIHFFVDGGNGSGGNPYNVVSEVTPVMEIAYNSRNLGVGVENMFINNGSNFDKSVERVDYVYSGGITLNASEGQNADEYGFAFFERNANNNFGIAAITGIDGDNNITSFGDLVMFGQNDLEGSGLNWGDPDLTGFTQSARLAGNIGDTLDDYDNTGITNGQDIGGVFITFEDLGISQGSTIFGYALFGGDQDDKNGGNAPSGANINNFSNDTFYEQNTGSIDGGGDLYGGGVIFELAGGPPTTILDPQGFYWDLNGSRAGATDDVENGGLTEAQQDAQLTDIWTNSASDNHWGSRNGGIETNGWEDNRVATFAAGSTDSSNTRDAHNNTYTVTVATDTVLANGILVEDGNLTIDSSGGGGIQLNTVSTEVPFIEVQNNAGDIKTRANGRATKISAPISGTTGIRKLGDGDLILSGNNTVSGTYSQEAGNTELAGANSLGGITTIDLQTGTLFLNATNAINDTGNMVLNGGNITVVDNFDHSDTLGTLTLNENSTIDMGTRTGGDRSIINFADSSGVTWDGTKQWSIVNWSGIGSSNGAFGAGVNGPGVNGGGGGDQIYFGNSNVGLTTAQLNQIKFINPEGLPAGTYAAIILADGEIVPLVPEAKTVTSLLILMGWIAFSRRKHWTQVVSAKKI